MHDHVAALQVDGGSANLAGHEHLGTLVHLHLRSIGQPQHGCRFLGRTNHLPVAEVVAREHRSAGGVGHRIEDAVHALHAGANAVRNHQGARQSEGAHSHADRQHGRDGPAGDGRNRGGYNRGTPQNSYGAARSGGFQRLPASHALMDVVHQQQRLGGRQGAVEIGGNQRLEPGAIAQSAARGGTGRFLRAEQRVANPVGGGRLGGRIYGLIAHRRRYCIESIGLHRCSPAYELNSFCI